MFYNKQDVINDLNNQDDDNLKNVKIFHNGFLQSENIISVLNLKNSFDTMNFSVTGSGLKEFYIEFEDGSEYTIQIFNNDVCIVNTLQF